MWLIHIQLLDWQQLKGSDLKSGPSDLSCCLLVTYSLPSSGAKTIQIVLATAHPAKFSEAVEASLCSHKSFNFERDVLPEAFKGLLEKERRIIDVAGTDPDLTKQVIEGQLGHLFEEGKTAEGTEQTLSV